MAASYLDALTETDLERVASLLTDDFSFTGPSMRGSVDRETFLNEFGGKYDFVRGVRVLRQVASYGQACTLYERDARKRRLAPWRS